MTKRMLIDAAHAEETRVVVVDGSRIEELDFESQSRKQLRGNIYLAKVTRVEPSLQAAFVEYGGNRHGFLAFNEVHPDYYQIPIADREALLREEAEDLDSDHHHGRNGHGGNGHAAPNGGDAEGVEVLEDDDVMEEELERRRRRLMRRYKIQEVIKRRQIMLVQVVKEERGNKGAALTSYLSLAGRYCVLMPNTARGGGISRKITNAADRKRLKSAAQSLDVPHGMGLIIRTAGAARTKAEIKRDYEYLLRLWETIREATLKSIAPALIYEEEDLVKRAIRDMYDKDLDGILVEGEAGYKEARDFMRMIMPSQAKKIQHYREATPLFVKHKVEDQLAQIHSPVVPLRSGGYLVINQTEALVAVDVNSGKATRERNIEATALKTNMEAAEETARQLRLRDLAGLIVIDFIDMDEAKNNRAVEKKLKDCLKDDRARVQMGKISPFGLMEISRQRRRSGVLEGTTHICEHCQGTGRIRSVESSALAALRAIEIEAARGGAGAITVRLCTAVGLYVLNEKRSYLARLEQQQGLIVTIAIDEALGQAEQEIERTAGRAGREPEVTEAYLPAPRAEPVAIEPEANEDEDEDTDDVQASDTQSAESGPEGEPGRPRRRRRRRGGRRDEGFDRSQRGEPQPRGDAGEVQLLGGSGEEDEGDEDEDEDTAGPGEAADDQGGRGRRRRRRGRRGGRRMREDGQGVEAYGWVHPHGGREEPHPNDEPYAWHDPHERGYTPRAVPVRLGRQAQPTDVPPPSPAAEASPSPAADAGAYVWLEPEVANSDAPEPVSAESSPPEQAPAEDTARPRRRSRGGGRSRSRSAEATTEAGPEPAPEGDQVEQTAASAPDEVPPADQTPEPPAMVEEPAATPAESVEPSADPAAQAAEPAVRPPQPALATVEAAPSAPREPDPAEILAPPAAPKRGWWRRGG